MENEEILKTMDFVETVENVKTVETFETVEKVRSDSLTFNLKARDVSASKNYSIYFEQLQFSFECTINMPIVGLEKCILFPNRESLNYNSCLYI